MKLEGLKAEAVHLLSRIREAEDDEHAIARLHTALVLAFKYGEQDMADRVKVYVLPPDSGFDTPPEMRVAIYDNLARTIYGETALTASERKEGA